MFEPNRNQGAKGHNQSRRNSVNRKIGRLEDLKVVEFPNNRRGSPHKIVGKTLWKSRQIGTKNLVEKKGHKSPESDTTNSG